MKIMKYARNLRKKYITNGGDTNYADFFEILKTDDISKYNSKAKVRFRQVRDNSYLGKLAIWGKIHDNDIYDFSVENFSDFCQKKTLKITYKLCYYYKRG